MKPHINIEINVAPDECTFSVYAKIVTQVMKYILFQRQQIPYVYDRMRVIVSGGIQRLIEINKDCENPPARFISQVERHFQQVKSVHTVMENAFQEIRKNIHDIEEVAVLLGATIYSPRECYRIILPLSGSATFQEKKGYTKSLAEVLRCIIESTDLQNKVNHPIGLTNTFVLIKTKEDANLTNFYPQPQYVLPKIGQHVHFNLINPLSKPDKSSDFGIFEDGLISDQSSTITEQLSSNCKISDDISLCKSTMWFQATEVCKGLKGVLKS